MSERPSSPPGQPHYVDVHVGNRIRARRLELGIDQTTLADCVGVSFQQIQKYEKGSNRVSASRLYDIARVMGTHVHYFFQDLETCDPQKNAFIKEGILNASKSDDGTVDPMKLQETIELANAYLALPDQDLREISLTLMRTIAGDTDTTPRKL